MSADIETFRDPLLSVFQSAVSEVASRIDNSTTLRSRRMQSSAESQLPHIAAQIARREVGLPATPPSTGVRGLSRTQTASLCAELAWRYVKAAAASDGTALALVEAEYVGSTCDAAWLSTLKEYHRYFGITGDNAAIPYIRAADVGPQVITIPSNASLALLADWGTGAGPALEVLIDIAKHGTKMGNGSKLWNHGYALLSLEGETCRAEYFEVGLQGRKTIFTEILE
ncbi:MULTISPECIES: hypothetical protein [unclassified Neorhizobium]|uniref:hypothetical protein n=1 Tax=unclassified Neorhizobium TaxID=2629175 RepID=UPI001FF28870|nr:MULTISPECIES: hypothetical protein [unclassified Neorhizobium]MCJ9674460.1 hypothetical protein [Neorhizobium sp. SHOUNA12B]MCJ9748980.1 hypothetical protein [Neorhizobium sp. SHOUNA12A]